ncbi:MAG: protease SohB [Gammaproteobacteria bacterium GWE2_42_36]|nr:MAG: protease SohB [Gammaproteobacteria bacterium GWE2_42_36]HCU05554.1 protease SohB [Coxiellaceae bacterium]
MLLHELVQFVFFLAKATVLVAAILMTIAGIVAIAVKGKTKESTKIKVKSLNEHYRELAEQLQTEILSKEAIKQLKKKKKDKKKTKSLPHSKPNTFILNFNGDLRATQVQALREEITAILMIAKPQDTVLVKVESAGGVVYGYGLAASELKRIKDRSISLIISVDKIAASGGYMMACVADRIIAAPFAVIGSIGVVAQLPNFHRLLQKHEIDFEQVTAGQYKRTLTLFGKNTEQDRQKVQEEVNEAHALFKEFIKQNRPQVDMDQVATGEHWFATRAIQFNLIDELMTSDEYLAKQSETTQLYEICLQKRKKLLDKLSDKTASIAKTTLLKLQEETHRDLY